MWTGSKQKQNTGFKRGTSVGSEQGWFVLALYNLSNFSLMLTVPILFVRHFKKCVKMCKSSLVFESEHSCDRGWAVIFTSTGQMRFSWLLCNTWKKKTTERKRKRKKKTPLFAVFCRFKTSAFLKLSFVLCTKKCRISKFHFTCGVKHVQPVSLVLTWKKKQQHIQYTHARTDTSFCVLWTL